MPSSVGNSWFQSYGNPKWLPIKVALGRTGTKKIPLFPGYVGGRVISMVVTLIVLCSNFGEKENRQKNGCWFQNRGTIEEK